MFSKINLKNPEYIFVVFCLLFGLIFMIYTPIFKVPDEPIHLLSACEVSNGIFFNNKNGDPAKDILPNRKILLKQNCACFKEFKNKFYYTDLLEVKNLNYTHNNTGYSFIMYIPSATAIKTVSQFCQNPYIQFYSARFANLFTYMLLVFCAIKITPVFKWQILICALFPMALYEGASLSADSFHISFSFLYTAVLFSMIFGKEKTISDKKFGLFLLTSFISIFMKGTFIFTLLIFLIPREKLANKCCLLYLWCIILLGTAFIYSSNNFIFIRSPINFEERKLMLLNSPQCFIITASNTLSGLWETYIKQSIGVFDWLIVFLPAYLYWSFPFLFISASFLEDTYCKLKNRLFALLLVLIFITMTLLLYYLTYSIPTNFIDGVQGRYFLPLYPLLAVIIQKPANIKFSDKQKFYLKTLIVLSLFLNLIWTSKFLINVSF